MVEYDDGDQESGVGESLIRPQPGKPEEKEGEALPDQPGPLSVGGPGAGPSPSPESDCYTEPSPVPAAEINFPTAGIKCRGVRACRFNF